MSRDDIRALVERHLDAINRHDVTALAAMYAEDAELISPMFRTVRGRQAIADSFVRLFEIFPDYTITTRRGLFLSEGPRAAQFATVTGTHRVALYGLPPTGQRIEYQAARLYTFVDGRIATEQRIYDFAGVLERLEKTRVDRELALASAVQQTLMARPPATGTGFDIVGSSLPSRAIGGDFLEYLPYRSGAFGLAIGDVSGKGPAAALIAAMLQGMFSLFEDVPGPPGEVVGRLNRGLFRRGVQPRYATLFYGVLEPDGRFAYTNAGHPAPLLIEAAGVRPLSGGGPVLGVFDPMTYPTDEVQLAPGDAILCYSDGVTEAESPDSEPFGLERLVELARARGRATPRAFVDHLLATLRTFSATGTPNDDATVAMLRYEGPGQTVAEHRVGARAATDEQTRPAPGSDRKKTG